MKKTARLLLLYFFLLCNILTPLARTEIAGMNASVHASQTKFASEPINIFAMDSLSTEFTSEKDADEVPPQIELQETGFNLGYLLTPSWIMIKELLNGLTQRFTSPMHFYHLLAATSLLALSIITLGSFFSRSKLAPAHLPLFLLYRFKKSHHVDIISMNGIVVDHETSHPITGANVYLFEETSDKIIAHSVSSMQGEYHFTNIPVGSYKVSVLKTGFHPFTIHKSFTTQDNSQIHLALSRKEIPIPLTQKVLHFTEGFLSSTFEVWLLLSFLLLILVGMSIGWEKIVGFLAIALFNLTAWSIHRAHIHHA